LADLRVAESIAGRAYWKAFKDLPIYFQRGYEVPDHWHTAGPRTPWRGGSRRPKGALTPAHAILNYLYAILETETTISIQRMGLDPTLGLMHADKRYRPSLASDLMEPVRPIADRIAIELLRDRAFDRKDAVETRKGVCRLGPGLARELGEHSDALPEAVGPYAKRLTRELLRAPDHATPVTQSRHRKSLNRA
jgi:Uncharacterized protein predicted to be involved in DNA repair